MSKPGFEDIDERILEATLEVAGTTPANRFSTKDIASKLGISEFVIFDHFQTKDNLLNKADEKIAGDYYNAVLGLGPTCHDFYEFFDKIMDFELSVPFHNSFAINYCRVFPRYEKASDFAIFEDGVNAAVGEVFKFFPIKDMSKAFPLWCYFTRELICDVQLIIDKHVIDTPEIRHFMAQCIYEGFGPFLLENKKE
jgi:AcrR family transcriptional regulator